MTHPLTPAAVAVAAALTTAGCTTAPQEMAYADPAGSQCFWANAVNNFEAVDNDTVNLRVGVNEVYQLELLGACPDVDWSQQIAIESRGTSRICTGLDATIISPSSIGPQRCPVSSIRRLTAAEVALLPADQRP